MKGLLLKDLRFTMQQPKRFLIIIFMIAWFLFFQGADSAPFVIAYVSMMGGFVALNTISFDEFDHSTTFLMTLPITRSDYVKEKYVFVILGMLSFWGAATSVYLFYGLDRFLEILLMALPILGVMLAVEMVMIPIQLKYGSDKGRIVFVGFVMGVAVLGYLAKEILQSNVEMQLFFEKIVNAATGVSAGYYAAGVLVLLAAETWISYKVSARMIAKREY